VNAKSKRPYLIRALFEWVVDSGLTPHILVAAGDPAVIVPQQYVSDGKIVLNISAAAVRDLDIGDEFVRFNGRFAGTSFAVEVPVGQVLAIYAKETGEGMMFDPEETAADVEVDSGEKQDAQKNRSAPHLKVIK